MIYAFDLHLMNYTTNMTRPVGYDFLEFDSFPIDSEIYDAIIEKYHFLNGYDHKPNKTYLFNESDICLGINFKFGDTDYRLIVNNVRSIGKNKNTEKYLTKVEF